MSYFKTIFSLSKFNSLGVRKGENSDFDTHKEVEKYEKNHNRKVVKSF